MAPSAVSAVSVSPSICAVNSSVSPLFSAVASSPLTLSSASSRSADSVSSCILIVIFVNLYGLGLPEVYEKASNAPTVVKLLGRLTLICASIAGRSS